MSSIGVNLYTLCHRRDRAVCRIRRGLPLADRNCSPASLLQRQESPVHGCLRRGSSQSLIRAVAVFEVEFRKARGASTIERAEVRSPMISLWICRSGDKRGLKSRHQYNIAWDVMNDWHEASHVLAPCPSAFCCLEVQPCRVASGKGCVNRYKSYLFCSNKSLRMRK